MMIMRPDQVHSTGTIAPLPTGSMHADVMAVAQSFTRGPYTFMQGSSAVTPGQGVAGPQVRLMGVAGFWPPSSWGWLNMLKARIAAWKAQRAAAKAITQAGTAGALRGLGFVPMGPMGWAAASRVPGPAQRVDMLLAVQSAHQPPQIAMQHDNVLMQRWSNLHR